MATRYRDERKIRLPEKRKILPVSSSRPPWMNPNRSANNATTNEPAMIGKSVFLNLLVFADEPLLAASGCFSLFLPPASFLTEGVKVNLSPDTPVS